MKALTSAAPCAGAQLNCVRTDDAAFRPVLRRELLRALRKARTRMGLSTGDVMVLDALLSFLPCKDPRTRTEIPVSPDMLLIVYASNASICDRANGMDDRVLRRHIARLCKRGLLGRRDSATGKRFPLKSGGRIRAAYGIDLKPLMLTAVNILEMADTATAEAEEARSLKAEALTIRAGILQQFEQFEAETIAFVERAKTILRRASLGLEGIKEILAVLRRIQASGADPTMAPCPDDHSRLPSDHQHAAGSGDTPGINASPAHPVYVRATCRRHDPDSTSVVKTQSRTNKESAANGQSVRQVESQKIDTKTNAHDDRTDPQKIWTQHRHVAELFPEAPRSVSDLREAIYLMGKYLALNERTLACAIASMGWLHCLKALDYLIANASRIEAPDGYLTRIVQDFQSGRSAVGISM